MKLENNYYDIISCQTHGTTGVVRIALRPDCEVYRGHFPGHPVCPGVCNMQTIREIAEHLTGHRLQVSTIRRCRLTAVATPTACGELDVHVQVEPCTGGFAVCATIADGQQTYMDYKGEMTL